MMECARFLSYKLTDLEGPLPIWLVRGICGSLIRVREEGWWPCLGEAAIFSFQQPNHKLSGSSKLNDQIGRQGREVARAKLGFLFRAP